MIAIIGGCSSDEPTKPAVTYGSNDDPLFVPVKTQIDNELTGIVGDILSGFDNLYVIPGDDSSVQAQLTPPSVVPDPETTPDTLTVVFVDGWHVIYATYLGETYFSRLADSVQYLEGTTAVEEPTNATDGIHFINNWTFNSLTPEATHIDYTGRNDFVFSNLDQPIAVISGSTTNTVESVYIGTDTTMTNLYTFGVTFTDLNVPQSAGSWMSGCPNSGTLNIEMSHVYTWENNVTFGSGGTNWKVTVHFTNGNANVYANNGTETWNYQVDVCGLSQ
jgi:hypothetical protein